MLNDFRNTKPALQCGQKKFMTPVDAAALESSSFFDAFASDAVEISFCFCFNIKKIICIFIEH